MLLHLPYLNKQNMKIYIRKETTMLGDVEYIVMVEHESIVKCLGIKSTEEEAIECYNKYKDVVKTPAKEIIKEEII